MKLIPENLKKKIGLGSHFHVFGVSAILVPSDLPVNRPKFQQKKILVEKIMAN